VNVDAIGVNIEIFRQSGVDLQVAPLGVIDDGVC
jgi:hypothetical protein